MHSLSATLMWLGVRQSDELTICGYASYRVRQLLDHTAIFLEEDRGSNPDADNTFTALYLQRYAIVRPPTVTTHC
jgi:hypothetical protein